MCVSTFPIDQVMNFGMFVHVYAHISVYSVYRYMFAWCISTSFRLWMCIHMDSNVELYIGLLEDDR